MAGDREPMARITLFATDEEDPSARDNFTLEVIPGATEGEYVPFENWDEWEKEQFPQVDGRPDPRVVLLQDFKEANSASQTCWFVKTSTGKVRSLPLIGTGVSVLI